MEAARITLDLNPIIGSEMIFYGEESGYSIVLHQISRSATALVLE